MKSIIFYLLLLISMFSFSQNQFETGSIIDSIPIGNTKDETFALYLPNSFDEDVLSSVVFVFDPSAKGILGIKPFIKASEKYGIIVVCSNNSKNGPYDQNFKIFDNLFSHIASIFKIKESEMYLSGFSGGSRLACAIASISDIFTGVVACGAGFPQIPEYMPNSQNYAYVGICGNRDFNYNEMIENQTFLNQLNFNNTLITNKSSHSWPNENELLRAFDWLYLQKLNKHNESEGHKKEIRELYTRDYNIALKHMGNNELIFAAENYKRLIESYSPFLKLDSITVKFKALKKSKDYHQQVKSLSSAIKIETEIINKLLTKFDLDLKNPNNNSLNWWKKELKRLQKIESSEDLEIKNMISRVKISVYATVYSTRHLYSNDASSLQHKFIKNLLNLLHPK